MNRIRRSEIAVRAGRAYDTSDLDVLLNNRGFLARIFRSLLRLVPKGWHMFPLGVLFGLDFDAAIEVAMFGVSASRRLGVSASRRRGRPKTCPSVRFSRFQYCSPPACR